jgi:hypothetical protein
LTFEFAFFLFLGITAYTWALKFFQKLQLDFRLFCSLSWSTFSALPTFILFFIYFLFFLFLFFWEKNEFWGITQNWVMTVAPLFTMLTVESLVRDFR